MAATDINKRIGSDSAVQKQAEKQLIGWLSRELGVPLAPSRISTGSCNMNVDAYYRGGNRVVLVEAWAHVGKAKAAQKNKVMTDVLKLAYLRDYLVRQDSSISVECYYVFADSDAAEVLVNQSSWNGNAGKYFGVRPRIAYIPENLRLAITQAQRNQDLRGE